MNEPASDSSVQATPQANAGVAQVAAERDLRPFVSPLLFRDADAGVRTSGAVMQIDIGGFTRAVEEYARRGSLALEDVANLIEGCFNIIVDTVAQYGGAAHTFPGDGLIAVWEAPEEGLYDVIGRARRCAQDLVASYPTPRRFPLKAGVGAGEMQILALGRAGTRRELLVTGQAMHEASTALSRAAKGKYQLGEFAESRAPREWHGNASYASVPDIVAGKRPQPDPAMLLDFMPRPVRQRIEAGLVGWTGEFRNVTTAFTCISPSPLLDTRRLHQLYDEVQRCVIERDGTMVQLCHDDKGLVCMIAFGVESAHEDDADRALGAMFALHESFASLGLDSTAGVTTGRAFCGLLGERRRMEFRLIGTAVNLAARLMSARRGILCDDATRSLARRFRFTDGVSWSDRKGRLVAFRPKPHVRPSFAVPDRFRRGTEVEPTYGRAVELGTTEAWLRAVDHAAFADGRILAIVGEPGIGKTQIASHLAQRAQSDGFRVLVSQSEQSGPGPALRGFRPALEQIFDLADLPLNTRRQRILDAVVAATGSAELAPLLEDLCDLGIEETPTTSSLFGHSRADNRLALLSRLFQAAATQSHKNGRHVLVFLEDVHWMDAASWTLLDILSSVPGLPMRFVMTLRSVLGELPVAAALIKDPRTTLIRLGPLSRNDTGALIAARMGATQATPQLIAAVYRHAEGNPLFCREVIRSLSEQSLVFVDAGTARLSRQANDIGAVSPESIEKVLQSRIDRLPTPQQWVLKCASVIGVRFSPAMLGLIQTHVSGDELQSALRGLVDAEFVESQVSASDSLYEFRHATVRGVAYASLLFEQRRELHAAIALALEADLDADRDPQAPFSHWRLAGESWRALRYVETGGNAAVREGDYHAARSFFEFGVQTLSDVPRQADDDRHSRWSHQLGEVLVALGRHTEARDHLNVALRLMGESVPRRRPGVAVMAAFEAFHQVCRRRAANLRMDNEPLPSSRQLAELYEQLGYVFYASGDTLRGAHAALAMLNRAERAGTSPVLARAYAAMSLTVSVTPLHRFGDLYEDAARRTAEVLADEAVTGWVAWIASLRAAGEARWTALFEGTACAIESAHRTADPRLAVMGSLTRAWALRLQGELAQASELARSALDTARTHGNHLWEAWALLIESECDLARHAYEAVITSSQRALDILVEESDRTEEIRAGGLLAAALHAQGQETLALRVVDTTVRATRAVDMTGFVMLEGFAGVAEVAVSRCERARARGQARMDSASRRAAQSACAELARYARVFPVGRPRAWQLRGRLLLSLGHQAAGVTALTQAVHEAERLAMPRERMLALRMLEVCGVVATGSE